MLEKLTKENINPSEWEFEGQQRNKQTILMADWWCRSLYNQLPVEIKFDMPPFDYLITGTSRFYVKKNQKREIIAELDKVCQGDDYLAYVMEWTMTRVAELDTLADGVEKTLKDKEVSNEQLAELWRRLDSVLVRVIPWFYIPWYISEYNILTNRVRNGLSKSSKQVTTITDLATALITVVFPTKAAAFQREQVDFYRLVNIAQGNSDFVTDPIFKQQAADYLKKYDWIVTFPLLPLPPLNYDGLIQKVRRAIKDNSIVEFQKQKKAKGESKILAEKIIRVLENDKRLVKNIEWSRELGYTLTASVEEALAHVRDIYRSSVRSLLVCLSTREIWVILPRPRLLKILKDKSPLIKKCSVRENWVMFCRYLTLLNELFLGKMPLP